ncbi:uncharacterized protein TRUGW13939_01333 [Talaromyces rugulosus]|uniref:Aspergillopepsin-2 n=1 Tax=Talaromyces rugulosus TaxID=121627 RepID=A0A7H8QJZ1_TALRU|nr:uncharacterized protein TRUGW13939_01333 [Talaromyces rugulosus]QKX54248.1 hypothetical protein TRUGW13939_01333 [Talaromyces rugulosus]
MKVSAVAGSLLLSGAAMAVPLSEANLARREANREDRASHMNMRIEKPNSQKSAFTADESYSTNWAGAVLIGDGYTTVSGTFVVPSVSVPSGGDDSTQYCAAAWVGIDGDTCSSAILQTGVNICIQNGEITNTAWYEWIPAAQSYWTTGITINTGDTITASVTADSTTSGTATVTNESSGESVSFDFTDQPSTLCQTNAEWIMEDLTGGGGLLPFANFGSDFAFSGASAVTGGNTVDTTGATIMDISQNNVVLTSTTASGGDVAVSYIGA